MSIEQRIRDLGLELSAVKAGPAPRAWGELFVDIVK
jgi:hypothetical protein